MKLKNKKIGIWGFGITGKSVARFVRQFTPYISILDKKHSAHEYLDYSFYLQSTTSPEKFITAHDFIFISPGIDSTAYHRFSARFICELDLFYQYFEQPIIAVTGTVGKTSTTYLITQILSEQGYTVACGGNIGTGMLDFITNKKNYTVGVLEVSSFQLEQCQYFAPDIAVWTNLYQNHLDRHSSMKSYALAKRKIYANQKDAQITFLPKDVINHLLRYQIPLPKNFHVLKNIELNDIKISAHSSVYLCNIYIALQVTRAFTGKSINFLPSINVPHRCEPITTYKGIIFFNDSKSTIPESTLAAVNAYKDQPIILFLGGLSKGVNREILIDQLTDHKNIKHILCFGNEAPQLHEWCKTHNLSSSMHSSLVSAFQFCLSLVQSGDIVLFSPGGSSYDLFTNFEERGNYFKKLVTDWAHERTAL